MNAIPSEEEIEYPDGKYHPIPLEPDGGLRSRTTGLLLRREGNRLRLIDAATGELLPWLEEIEAIAERDAKARAGAEAARLEAEARATMAEERATAEAAARAEVEARIKSLEEEIARLRGAGS